MKPQHWPNLSLSAWEKFWCEKEVSCSAASLLQPRTSGSTPQLFQTSCMQPLQQLGSAAEMWLLPKHMTVYCCCCQLTLENNPNSSSKQPWPKRLISMKKLFPRKELEAVRSDWWLGAAICRNSSPKCVTRTERGLHRTAPVQGAAAAVRRNRKRRKAELTWCGPAVLLCSVHWWQSQSWESTLGSLMLTRRRQSEIETQTNLKPPFP